jgi:2,4-dienoyl-CoA reductase-like NADH-dependent reductase (Old Yellow Enzyme family)/thioredoxin reductase
MLFSPYKIGTLELANRIVMAPMATYYGTSDGYVTDRNIAYYAERARGGVGYITMEHTAVAPNGRAGIGMPCLYDDSYVPGIARLIDAVHREGAKIVVQLNHGGRQALEKFSLGEDKQIVAPSGIPCPIMGGNPRELTVDEIRGLVDAFVGAAVRAKQAGADGVELHMAHGYLMCSFLSPFSNRRTDEYGGDLPRRMQFPLEVLEGVREGVGKDYPVVCRFSADGYVEGGITSDDGLEIGGALAAHGADALSVTAGSRVAFHHMIAPYYQPRGNLIHLAEAVKQRVAVPVMGVGRIPDPRLAEEMLQAGKADLIVFGRAFLADPHWPNKAREGRFDEIIPCIACNSGCIERRLSGGLYTSCLCNPLTGNEEELKITSTSKPRKVMVVGAGPAGLQAALVASQRGHEVSLWERGDRIGGNFRIAALAPGKEELGCLLEYFEGQLDRSSVRVELGKTAAAEALAAENPDAVVAATGAEPATVAVEGLAEAAASGFVVQGVDVLEGKVTPGKRVVVVGGGNVGLETADALAEQGHEVTVIEMLPDVGADMVAPVRQMLLERLDGLSVEIRTRTVFHGIEGRTLLVEEDGKSDKIEGVDTVVLAVGFRPRREVADEAQKLGKEVHVIGDAKEARSALEAIYEAHRVAVEL